jgi:hypothetical protein
MHLRLGLFALVLSSASAAMAIPQPADPTYAGARPLASQPFWQPEPIYPVERASRAFGHCIASGIRGIDATLAAEVAADSLMNACATQFHDVERETERVIAAAHWTDNRKEIARAELRARLLQVEQRISARIREARLRTATSR